MGCISTNGRASGKFEKKINRVLLLGIGGSGKSTFTKQMQIIHQGISPDVAKSYRGVLLTNIILGFKAICAQKDADYENNENYKKSRWILQADENFTNWDRELIERIKSLWLDRGFRSTWEEIKDGCLIQLDYLMNNLDRFSQENFVPTNDDILRGRQRTTGSQLYTHVEEERIIWELTDVGGQYSERLKWGSYFEEDKIPHAIIFFLAIDEYNVLNTETKTEQYKTKFDLALSVFEEIMCTNGPVIDHRLCRILFLNKIDLFEEKIKDENKWQEFKQIMNYDGPRTTQACSISIIEQKIKNLNKKLIEKNKNNDDDDLELKIHITNALDTKMMTKISKDIKTSIMTYTLNYLGMI